MHRCSSAGGRIAGPVLVAFALASCAPADEQPPPPAEPYPWHWVGDDGRVVIHRGVNLNDAAKRSDGYHHGLTAADLALLPEHGFTMVRLLVFWEALEPAEGNYDAAYLAQVRADVQALAELDLEVVLDLHQDVYGEGFGFTGFPRWTCDESAYAAFTPDDGSWFINYFDPAVIGCFDAFWESTDLQEAYARMAARLVEEVADLPAVVGFDVINEPFFASHDWLEHDEVILPAFYERIVDEVRPVHPTLRLFLAPSVAANIFARPALDLSGLDDPRLGVAPHFYPPYAELGTGWNGDFQTEAATLGRLADHARNQEAPLLLGEFGIFSSVGNEPDFIRSVLRAVEGEGGSTAYWSYDRGRGLVEGEGEPGWLLAAWADPWPHRIPGRLEAVENGSTVRFTLHGSGTVEWVALDPSRCTATLSAGTLVSVEVETRRVLVHVEGDGEARVALECD